MGLPTHGPYDVVHLCRDQAGHAATSAGVLQDKTVAQEQGYQKYANGLVASLKEAGIDIVAERVWEVFERRTLDNMNRPRKPIKKESVRCDKKYRNKLKRSKKKEKRRVKEEREVVVVVKEEEDFRGTKQEEKEFQGFEREAEDYRGIKKEEEDSA